MSSMSGVWSCYIILWSGLLSFLWWLWVCYGNNVSFQGASNDGTYMRTSYSVSIYTESGHCKGTYAIYLHNSKSYIYFSNTWICIQGKSRFGYNGNWYIIK